MSSKSILLLVLFVSLFSPVQAQPGCASPTFAAGVLLPSFSNATAPAVADVNGDGRLDLLVSTNYGSGFSLFLGQESGFTSSTFYYLATDEVRSFSVGDVNNDGRADLAVIVSGGVRVLFGLPGGGFGQPAHYITGQNPWNTNFPRQAAIADFNGDGWADLAVANGDTYLGAIGILLNNGSGQFAPPVMLDFESGGKSPSSIVTADFNEDGKADLAASGNDGQIRVLLGQGDGSFAPPLLYGTGGSLAVGDLNGDGKPDLAATANNSVGVLLNNGSGGFLPIQYFSSGGKYPTALAIGDLNGDGQPDIAASNYWSASVGVLFNKGGGVFTAGTSYFAGGRYAGDLVIGNVDGTGGNDILVAGNGLTLLPNSCSTTDLKSFYRDWDQDGWGDSVGSVLSTTRPGGFVENKEDCNDLMETYLDEDGDGHGNSAGVKAPCGSYNRMDCNDNNIQEHPYQQWFIDKDGDKSGAAFNVSYQCERPPYGYTRNELVDVDDCDDNDPTVKGRKYWYHDADGDGYHSNAWPAYFCETEPPYPTGFSLSTKGWDCDDSNPNVYKQTTYYLDEDRDGYGGTAYPVDWCSQFPPYGFSSNNSDCNDADASIYPGAPELIDDKDNNCNGQTDETVAPITWYRDYDKDGFGDPKRTIISPTQPAGYVANHLDCNDYAITYEDKDSDGRGSTVKVPCSQIYRSDDCNDDDRLVHTPQTFYRDADGDSYGNAGNKIQVCASTPPTGYVKNSIDCDDADPKVYWPKAYYRDADGDGFGDKNNKTNVCASMPPSGYVTNMTDCDDNLVLYKDGDKDGYGSTTKVPCGGVANNVDCDDNNGADKGCTHETCPTTVFTPIALYNSTGGGPSAIAIADFNGDGKKDMAVSNYSSNQVGVLLNSGSGDFSPAIPFIHGGSGATSLTAADFNGDGKPDLAVALDTYELTNLAILLNNGSGGFLAPVLLNSSGRMPQSIISGDFNGDGKTDLAVANFVLNVGVLFGNGSGGFAPAVNYHTAGQNCSSITTGDFNGDGKPDLAVANHGTNNIGILLNSGSGFAPASAFKSGGWTPTSVAAGDFNGDGRPDLAVTNYDSDNVGVFNGNGSGSFTHVASFHSGGHHPFSVKTGDFNGDTKLDLVMTNSSSHQVGIHLNNGSGSFLPSINYISGGQNPMFVATGQLNEDHRLDLVVANAGTNNVGVMLNACSAVPPQLTKAQAQPQGKPSLTAMDEGSAMAVSLSALPNPMGNKTLIRFTLHQSAEVNIRVHDVLGREVKNVFSGKQSAGSHGVEYNTSKLSSGVYYCRMVVTVAGKQVVRTLKLVKAE